MRIAVAADHAGYKLKARIISSLRSQNILVEDMGAREYNPIDDYPDYVVPLINKLLVNQDAKGILICRNGVGVSVLANKFKGIRAALSWTEEHAKSSKIDDNTNVLALPADYISEDQAIKIVEAWVNTPFSDEDRHLRRLAKVKDAENKI